MKDRDQIDLKIDELLDSAEAVADWLNDSTFNKVSDDFNDVPGLTAELDALKNTFNIAPVVHGVFRVRPQATPSGWDYTNIAAGSTAFEVVDVEPETAYTFEDCTHTFDNFNSFIYINKAGSAFGMYEGLASDVIITPRDCHQVVFSMKDGKIGPALMFKKLENYHTGKTGLAGGNLANGDYQLGYQVIDDNGTLRFTPGIAATTSSIPVKEGKSYYYFKNNLDNGISNVALAQDENDNNIAFITSGFSGSGTVNTYTIITIPEGLGIVKIRLLIAAGNTRVNELKAGLLKFGLVDFDSYRIIEDFKEPNDNMTLTEVINEVVDLRAPIKKTFQDRNLMIIGDSVFATQASADNAHYNDDVRAVSHQSPNKLRGGALAEFVRRLMPGTWTNYSHGGFTMTYSGPHFGQDIYTNNDGGNYPFLLERFFHDYDAYVADPQNNDPRYTPDAFLIASCINDFINPTAAWVTEAELGVCNKEYDQYMEDTFMTSDPNNSTLKPLDTIDLTKVAGALRYLVERIYRKFPKCYIAVVTPNKTSIHKRENQYKCVRDMIWMANRLNVQVIDVFNGGSQMINLKEFNDSVTGTQDELYLTSDGVHPYGSAGKGDERQGRFITNEFVNGYFALEDF